MGSLPCVKFKNTHGRGKFILKFKTRKNCDRFVDLHHLTIHPPKKKRKEIENRKIQSIFSYFSTVLLFPFFHQAAMKQNGTFDTQLDLA